MMTRLTIHRQTKWKVNATLAIRTKKTSKKSFGHTLIAKSLGHTLVTKASARVVGSPKVAIHPNKNRKIGSGAPK